jgi:ABC-2 type transport system ATP-binding protein
MNTIREEVRRGLTVFLTTQFLEDAEYLCGRVAVIFGGRIIWEGTPPELKDAYGGVRLVDVLVGSGDPGLLAGRMRGVKSVTEVAMKPDGKVRIWASDQGGRSVSSSTKGGILGSNLGA